MKKLRNHEQYDPLAKPEAMIQGEKYRFTVLTSRLIRIEYSEEGAFLDDATFAVQNRNFDVPDFSVTRRENWLRIETGHICLQYDTTKAFDQESLQIYYTGKNASVYAGRHLPRWRFGVSASNNLRGTTVSLDTVDGACPLENGIMSLGEITVLDDVRSYVLSASGQYLPRQSGQTVDQYLFCYGCADAGRYDFAGALRDYYQLTGKPPMLPRYVLGNWWCRYYAYTQQEYLNLMNRFQKEDIPFSVAVLDMDWHYVKIDSKYGGGWTGYSWNRELFPDHKKLLSDLHEKNIHVGLNLHPQGGVAAHEDAYEPMADAMGTDKEKEETVSFNIHDQKFVESYFELLHRPHEKDGVDFWWIDYNTKIRELSPDPAPLLNHYHYVDNENDTRAMILSRYAGPGSHRYPIGFSGDTVSSWDSLAFQPYFTANAANIGFGWWSHDIGGFQMGSKDDELIARWVQFGVFSPINRLHSSNLRYMSKEPWRYNKICEAAMKRFLKLRHALIPYLYSTACRHAQGDFPLVHPLYYRWQTEEAFRNKQEYAFGSELLVSPIVQSMDPATRMGAAKVWLPEGIWYDFFTERKYIGDEVFTAYRDLNSMPVFAKAGGIIPMTKPSCGDNDTSNPTSLYIKVFCGADGSFQMYEDDGISYACENGCFALTDYCLQWGERPVFAGVVTKADCTAVPACRDYEIEFIGMQNCDVSVSAGIPFAKDYTDGVITVTLKNVSGDFTITLGHDRLMENDLLCWLDAVLENASIQYTLKETLYRELTKDVPLQKKINFLMGAVQDEHMRLALLEIITHCDI